MNEKRNVFWGAGFSRKNGIVFGGFSSKKGKIFEKKVRSEEKIKNGMRPDGKTECLQDCPDAGAAFQCLPPRSPFIFRSLRVPLHMSLARWISSWVSVFWSEGAFFGPNGVYRLPGGSAPRPPTVCPAS